jgi:hypothetical protein
MGDILPKNEKLAAKLGKLIQFGILDFGLGIAF